MANVGHVAGLDASVIQVEMARRRLGDRIAAGTGEIVMGDAAALPWGDGRFGVVTSLACFEFLPGPQKALSEMHRVLRPGGRAVLAHASRIREVNESGTKDEVGRWRWSDADARRMMEEAGFASVAVSFLPWSHTTSRLVNLLVRAGHPRCAAGPRRETGVGTGRRARWYAGACPGGTEMNGSKVGAGRAAGWLVVPSLEPAAETAPRER